ncbi:hypothetical protein PACTADRAFT_48562 [Pachysolen tannophilus NRRL Y-2460]|uniref:Ubiquitin-like domain-containing protein n=1 Tax=Pachysolen tannophilus NRRL Y-2460 TaxID=669874 RepID=A0A1E4TYC3_PACTA|nr:hypothetical protein PACTADRAFT_48562 [Pachysolen tannophilus NRRL Y-2460]
MEPSDEIVGSLNDKVRELTLENNHLKILKEFYEYSYKLIKVNNVHRVISRNIETISLDIRYNGNKDILKLENVPKTYKIVTVKQLIYNKAGLLIKDQLLYKDLNILQDGFTLADYLVEDGDTITLTHEVNIFIKDRVIRRCPYDTFVKDLFEGKKDKNNDYLTFNDGMILNRDKLLSDYGITTDTVLFPKNLKLTIKYGNIEEYYGIDDSTTLSFCLSKINLLKDKYNEVVEKYKDDKDITIVKLLKDENFFLEMKDLSINVILFESTPKAPKIEKFIVNKDERLYDFIKQNFTAEHILLQIDNNGQEFLISENISFSDVIETSDNKNGITLRLGKLTNLNPQSYYYKDIKDDVFIKPLQSCIITDKYTNKIVIKNFYNNLDKLVLKKYKLNIYDYENKLIYELGIGEIDFDLSIFQIFDKLDDPLFFDFSRNVAMVDDIVIEDLNTFKIKQLLSAIANKNEIDLKISIKLQLMELAASASDKKPMIWGFNSQTTIADLKAKILQTSGIEIGGNKNMFKILYCKEDLSTNNFVNLERFFNYELLEICNVSFERNLIFYSLEKTNLKEKQITATMNETQDRFVVEYTDVHANGVDGTVKVFHSPVYR